MSQQDQSTATQQVDRLDRLPGSDLDITLGDPVRYADDVVDYALRSRANATLAATGASEPGADTATLPDYIEQENEGIDLSRIVSLPVPPRARSTSTLHALQEWEGYVVAIDNTEFLARLVDLTAGSSHEEEEANIPLDEISDYDAARIQVGSIFRWVIGYERSATGTKRRVSQIVFRDLPAVTKSDLQDGEDWAREVTRSLNL